MFCGPEALTVDGTRVSSEDVGRAAYHAICQLALDLRSSHSSISEEILDLCCELDREKLFGLFRDFAVFFTEFYKIDQHGCVYVDVNLLVESRFGDLDCLVCKYTAVLDEQAPVCDVIVDTAMEAF